MSLRNFDIPVLDLDDAPVHAPDGKPLTLSALICNNIMNGQDAAQASFEEKVELITLTRKIKAGGTKDYDHNELAMLEKYVGGMIGVLVADVFKKALTTDVVPE